MLSQCQRDLLPRMLETTGLSILSLIYRRYSRRSWLRSYVIFWKVSLLPVSLFSYRRGLGTRKVLLTVSHHFQVALDGGMEGRLVQLDFSAAFGRMLLKSVV